MSRRRFLQQGALVSAAALTPRRGWAGAPRISAAPVPRAVLDAAIDAARRAGASYADVQARFTQREDWYIPGTSVQVPQWRCVGGIGVRALANGCWGFAASSGDVTADAAAALGRDAAAQAAIAGRVTSRTAALAPVGTAAVGEWVMPVEIDPFTVSAAEKSDFLTGMYDMIQRLRLNVLVRGHTGFLKDVRTFASSDGAFVTQTLFNTQSDFDVDIGSDWRTGIRGMLTSNFCTPAGAGWEYVRRALFAEEAERLIRLAVDSQHPTTSDVGRYDIVLDAAAAATLVDQSLGIATELDRAYGDVANTVGTSYVWDPLSMLGTLPMGSPLLTLRMTRSLPGGAATVRWDDEGVAPSDVALVRQGVLADMQTTRESASWIAPFYARSGQPLRSNGCAGTAQATDPVETRSPNFVLEPGAGDVTFDALVKDTKKGIAFVGGYSRSDYQGLNGYGQGAIAYSVTNGVLGQPVLGAAFAYRAPELWKGLVALGGAASARSFGQWRQRTNNLMCPRHTVRAVPVKLASIPVVDLRRKA